MVYAGLCGSCRNARVIGNRRGSQFTMCQLSRMDERFPRYPRLPVVNCSGYAPVLDTGTGATDPVTPDASAPLRSRTNDPAAPDAADDSTGNDGGDE